MFASTQAAMDRIEYKEVLLDGDLTIYQVGQVKHVLHEALQDAKSQALPLRLNMSAVTECDGAGLQLLLVLGCAARTSDTRIEMAGLHTDIADMFSRYGVHAYFTMAAEGAGQ
jgi:anti-anti-sigma regulatory factor